MPLYGGVASPGILGRVQYAPATATTYTTSSSTYAAVDSTNLTVTFTAPASGNVMFVLTANGDGAASSSNLDWGVGPHGGSVAVAGQVTSSSGGGTPSAYTNMLIVTGLTAGTSYQYDWFHASSNNSSACHTYAGPTVPATLITQGRGPATMVVFAL